MNFIVPKNYKFKPKLFGLINYQIAILDSILAGILYIILKYISISITLKLYFFIALFLPIIIFSIVGANSENIVSVLIYILKFYSKPNLYLYKKDISNC